jgi:GTP pyrophosphokinase
MSAWSDRLSAAFAYAHHLHRDQRRKGSDIPYIAHLMAVASLALEYGASEDDAIAALLHDAVEDQGGEPTLTAIRERFGEGVAATVAACTDSLATGGDPARDWQQRKQAFVARIPHEPASAQLVSACDKLHNAGSLLRDYRQQGEALWDRFRGRKTGTLWYYRALTDAFARAGAIPAPLQAELEATVSALEQASA